MWRIVGVLVALIVVLTVLGLVVRALRWLLIAALVVAVASAFVGALVRRRS